ncbi:tRNA pseudouridine(13) synthase TruD, partial [Mariniblastus sp.]|nr:tRNA pseudouridine(13) synthase TruD [Mariniblastus sp.]
GVWDSVLTGEVFGFSDNRSLVLPHNLRGDESARVAAGDLELTAPLWGLGELQSAGEVKILEQQVADEHAQIISGLEQFNLKQERRVIRLKPLAPDLEWESNETLILRFELPKGTYATTLLKELVCVT